MNQDESVDPTLGSAVPVQGEAVPAAAEGGELAQASTEGLSFGALANPNRLRLGASRSL
ncbi:hypothetical protein MXD63_31360 [Frankia sp. Cpl3]|uniref:hypothetical protein n=1 Tax=Parafrankia colletiae TaxID=573497 RepID=UPI000ADD6AC3|nr:hypothetical protein [Parafrankia colletiae]MCK9904529.1 hypothetical protein [Frankia sp. Cpl3]